MARILTAFVIGLVFGTGIMVSGMANPAKVLNFFDFAGTWDPSLAFVMGGALVVTAIGYRLAFRMPHPLLSNRFAIPTRKDIDVRLLSGAGIFGIGWGLSGFCPGGLVPALGLGRSEPAVFFVALIAGILAVRVADMLRSRQRLAASS
ncbi:YeeE/YedE family protein [Polymorphum gilvum]|uniref:Predicted transporter component n=1 Tax=Polymorphum gilvum (strain LMG 25793 / CGMCC 1.9160 / SL003B-26A1) TaxID=991905 RepID=F2IVG1_POLGS|nr:YeeE/YedE family protein [Polymorphum gilvum]ADZ72679.1 Predicted transporter component [Polymorphum gilvum SL003B-26A1]